MSVEANKAVAIAIVEAAGTGRHDRSLFTDDAVWWMQGTGELQIDAFIDMTKAFAARLLGEGGRMDIQSLIGEDDRVAVEAECFVPLKNGTTYNNTYHFLIRLRGGKAYQVKEYHDTAVAERAFRRPAAQPS